MMRLHISITHDILVYHAFTSLMYTKRQVEITLTVECYDDLYLQDVVENTDWNDILSLEGDEKVDIRMKEFECHY